MRICYIAFNRLPTEKAHGLQIVKTCEALADLGAQVDLVYPLRKNPITDDVYAYYGAKRNFSITPIPILDFVSLGFVGYFFSLVMFSERAHFRKEFWNADAIYSRDAFVLVQFVLLGRPLVFEVHQEPSILRTFVAKRAKNVVVISHALKQEYRRAGVPESRIIVAPDAVDLEIFHVRESKEEAKVRCGLPINVPVVLYAGHLYERKGAYKLAEALSRMSSVLGVFVGGVSVDVERFKAQWGNASSIRILGHKPPADIPHFLRAADVLVIPNSSKDTDSSLYTSPMKLFEYMASGTPIVASRVPSILEVVGEDGVVFAEPDDSVSLEKAILNVLSEREVSPRALRAREIVNSFTWRRRAERILRSIR